MVYLKRTGAWPEYRYWYWHPKETCLVTSRGCSRPQRHEIASRPSYIRHPLDPSRTQRQVGDVAYHELSGQLCDIVRLGSHGRAEVYVRCHDDLTDLPQRELTLVSANVAGGPGMHPADPNFAEAIWAVEQAHLESAGQFSLDNYILDHYPALHIGEQTMRDFHERLLGHVFPWAGTLRKEAVWVGRRDSPTPPSKVVPQQVQEFFHAFANPLLRRARADRHSLLAALSELHCELARIHPFMDGNGRVIRRLCDVIALQRGYRLEWRLRRSDERKRYHYAVRKAVHQRRRYFLNRLLERALTRL